MDAELLEVLTGTSEKEEMDKIWRTVLLNQFHDILPGSSIAEVYEVTKKEYAEIESRLAEMIAEKLNLLMDGGQDKISVFNTLGFDRNDVVSLGDCHAAALTDESGKIYPVQKQPREQLHILQIFLQKAEKLYSF